jgi:hypothetical protein
MTVLLIKDETGDMENTEITEDTGDTGGNGGASAEVGTSALGTDSVNIGDTGGSADCDDTGSPVIDFEPGPRNPGNPRNPVSVSETVKSPVATVTVATVADVEDDDVGTAVGTGSFVSGSVTSVGSVQPGGKSAATHSNSNSTLESTPTFAQKTTSPKLQSSKKSTLLSVGKKSTLPEAKLKRPRDKGDKDGRDGRDGAAENGKKKKRKKSGEGDSKKKRDEIDDIFGDLFK